MAVFRPCSIVRASEGWSIFYSLVLLAVDLKKMRYFTTMQDFAFTSPKMEIYMSLSELWYGPIVCQNRHFYRSTPLTPLPPLFKISTLSDSQKRFCVVLLHYSPLSLYFRYISLLYPTWKEIFMSYFLLLYSILKFISIIFDDFIWFFSTEIIIL